MEATRRTQGSGNPGTTVDYDYDGHECEHLQSLRMCLLDAIHALYIKALAILPYAAGNSCFLRALFVAGHCYGLMDPVSNIILSSVWYDINFPPEEQYTADSAQTIYATEGIDGILDTSIMCRVEYRSLAGLVFMFHSIYQTISSVHKALEYLYFWNCDLTRIIGAIPHPFDGVARAANHPQHSAFESFLSSLSPEKVTHLCSLLQTKPDGRISHAHWIELRETLCNERVSTTVRYAAHSLSLEARMQVLRKKSAFVDKLAFIRIELERVLRKYCDQHPWEPSYQLDIICGVHVESKTFYPPRFYHANFLASAVAYCPMSAHSSSLNSGSCLGYESTCIFGPWALSLGRMLGVVDFIILPA
ncbi:uncharacterized protein C2845_PM03G08040 [Panicum miliaceum]|uniref:Uncharacterized protein n=1 Tax=Panicum miliaceum TaxID=4540 RepID=A0A3L6TC35_PANMI|nr:uncharacterized protein C2845_PM03G08040 [Panicum miliaceum]